MKMILVDSSVLFTAVNSPTGGSAKLFTLTDYTLIVTPLILTEVERNVRQKLQPYHLERLFILIKKLQIISQVPDAKLIVQAKRVIVAKDAVILAEAKQSGVDILVTLDRKHFLQSPVIDFLQPQRVCLPKDLLQ